MDVNKINKSKQKNSFMKRYIKSLIETIIPLINFVAYSIIFIGFIAAIVFSLAMVSFVPIIIYIVYTILFMAYVNMEKE